MIYGEIEITTGRKRKAGAKVEEKSKKKSVWKESLEKKMNRNNWLVRIYGYNCNRIEGK